MKNSIILFLTAAAVLVLLGCVLAFRSGEVEGDVEDADTEVQDESALPQFPGQVCALMKAYPDFVIGFEDNHVIFADSTRMVWDDGREKDFQKKLDDPDLEDMYSCVYPLDSLKEPAYLEDPGRFRTDAFFRKMYGNSPAEVTKNMRTVKWFDKTVKFTTINGAADSLEAVCADLEPYKAKYAAFLDGPMSYNWREVRGANRLSAHSFGMALDIGVPQSNYWKWTDPKAGELDHVKYKNRFPAEIIYAFERHGFISGVRWYHYDTMHFEFRPDLIEYSRNLVN